MTHSTTIKPAPPPRRKVCKELHRSSFCSCTRSLSFLRGEKKFKKSSFLSVWTAQLKSTCVIMILVTTLALLVNRRVTFNNHWTIDLGIWSAKKVRICKDAATSALYYHWLPMRWPDVFGMKHKKKCYLRNRTMVPVIPLLLLQLWTDTVHGGTQSVCSEKSSWSKFSINIFLLPSGFCLKRAVWILQLEKLSNRLQFNFWLNYRTELPSARYY